MEHERIKTDTDAAEVRQAAWEASGLRSKWRCTSALFPRADLGLLRIAMDLR
jgi:hypothetical protein